MPKCAISKSANTSKPTRISTKLATTAKTYSKERKSKRLGKSTARSAAKASALNATKAILTTAVSSGKLEILSVFRAWESKNVRNAERVSIKMEAATTWNVKFATLIFAGNAFATSPAQRCAMST